MLARMMTLKRAALECRVTRKWLDASAESLDHMKSESHSLDHAVIWVRKSAIFINFHGTPRPTSRVGL